MIGSESNRRDDSTDNERTRQTRLNRRSLLGAGAAIGTGFIGFAGFGSTTMAQTDSSGTVVIEGTGVSTTYEIVVTGELSEWADGPGGLNSGDEISSDGTTANGSVGGGHDPYAYTGDLVRVTINGEAIIHHDGSSDGGTTNGGDTTTHRLDVNGDGSRTDYTITVSGSITYVDGSQNSADQILNDGTTADGHVGSGTDSVEFTGDITAFEYSGDAEFVLDGEVVDPDTLGGGSGTTTHRFDVDGDGSRTDYTITVSGSIAYVDGSQNSADVILNDGTTADGHVGSGIDSMEFDGDITAFEYSGDAEFRLDGEVVDPDTLGDGSGGGSDGSLSEGVAMFIFDDDKPDHIRVIDIFEEFDRFQDDATFAVVTGRTDESSQPSIGDFKNAQEGGDEIISHTETHCNNESVFDNGKLTSGSDSAVRRELENSKQWLQDNGFWESQSIVYPRGGVDDRVERMTAEAGYDYGFAGGLREPITQIDNPLRIPRQPIQNVSETKEMIRRAGANGGLVPIMGHSVVSNPSGNEISPSQLRSILTVAEEEGVETVTPRDLDSLF